METVNVRVRYRPLRLGLCIAREDLEGFREAVRVATTMWGGQYNVIVPVDEEPVEAQALVDAFRVDALFAINESAVVEGFVEKNAHLRWPDHDPHLFVRTHQGLGATVLDIYHPIRRLVESQTKTGRASLQAVRVRWDDEDPLKDVFLATFGAYPTNEELERTYQGLFDRLDPEVVRLTTEGAVAAEAFERLSPLAVTTLELTQSDVSWVHREPGFYVGSANDVTDLVNFWNLRAANMELVFYDAAHHERLEPAFAAHLKWLQSLPKRDTDWPFYASVWSKTRESLPDRTMFGPGFAASVVDEHLWEENTIWKPASVGFEQQSVLATVSEQFEEQTVTFQLPKKPFFEHFSLHDQKVVLSVRTYTQNSDFILNPPYTPGMNEFYGRRIAHDARKARSERDGIGLIVNVDRSDLTIRALNAKELIEQLFRSKGVKASLSNAGRVVHRLIDQMGGLQGCRVFKIPGVRELIRAHGPLHSFTRSGAVQMIRGKEPGTTVPTFEAHKHLHLFYRPSGDWKPEDAFVYLLDKRMFRAGLSFVCPKCGLDFWLHVDAVKTTSVCEYCDTEFNVLPQLRDRDWRFRRSGLFGRDDDQGGGIPVSTVLQQLETSLGGRLFAWTAGINLASGGEAPWACESDFVLLTESGHEGSQIVVAEVKSRGGEITAEDVRNLSRVADLFEKTTLAPYIVFAKLGVFTQDEIDRCRGAKHRRRSRVILLSERELEPYFVYERTAEQFQINQPAVRLQDLAEATEHIFFSPRLKAAARPLSS